MDEPTIGLDPIGAEMLRNTILKINKNGTTVLLTTHNMYEADELCARIAIIKSGEFLTVDTPANIKASLKPRPKPIQPIVNDEITLEDAYIQLVKGEEDA